MKSLEFAVCSPPWSAGGGGFVIANGQRRWPSRELSGERRRIYHSVEIPVWTLGAAALPWKFKSSTRKGLLPLDSPAINLPQMWGIKTPDATWQMRNDSVQRWEDSYEIIPRIGPLWQPRRWDTSCPEHSSGRQLVSVTRRPTTSPARLTGFIMGCSEGRRHCADKRISLREEIEFWGHKFSQREITGRS